MEPLYKKIDASTPPEKDGEYLTNLGWTRYDITTKEWYLSNYSQTPNWYFLPVTGEKMSFEQAREKIAKGRGAYSWVEFLETENDAQVYSAFDEAAELYLSANTAHLLEELERVKDGYLKCSAGYLSVRTEANQLAEVLELWVKADDDFETNMGRNGMEIAAQSAVINNAKRKAKERLSAYRTETKGGSNVN